jgi:hypothetical protein
VQSKGFEPTDETELFITIQNTDPKATAKNVRATVAIKDGNGKGVALRPNDRDFGTIPPCDEVTKEFCIVTERAGVGEYGIQVQLSYDYSFPTSECETAKFVVQPD